MTKRVRGASLRVPHPEQIAVVVEALAQLVPAVHSVGRNANHTFPRRQRLRRRRGLRVPRPRKRDQIRAVARRQVALTLPATASPRSCCSAVFARSAAIASPSPANAKLGSCVSA